MLGHTNDLLSAIHHIPVGYGLRLLLALVPHAGKHNEDRLTAGLKDPKKCSYCYEAREVLARRMQGKDRTPEHDVD
jgi:hypothetical protein